MGIKKTDTECRAMCSELPNAPHFSGTAEGFKKSWSGYAEI